MPQTVGYKVHLGKGSLRLCPNGIVSPSSKDEIFGRMTIWGSDPSFAIPSRVGVMCKSGGPTAFSSSVFLSENANIAICSVHQAVDQLDIVIGVDECSANLWVHQVVGYLQIVLAGVEEEELLFHGRVGLRQFTVILEAALERW